MMNTHQDPAVQVAVEMAVAMVLRAEPPIREAVVEVADPILELLETVEAEL